MTNNTYRAVRDEDLRHRYAHRRKSQCEGVVFVCYVASACRDHGLTFQ